MATSLKLLKGVGDAVEKKLRSIGVGSVEELIDMAPRQYADLSLSVPVEGAEEGSYCIFDGIITEKSLPRKKGKLTFFSATARSGEIFLRLVWFNHSYVHKVLEIGETYTFFGKMKIHDFRMEFNNPYFEKKSEKSKFCGIVPIYATKGVFGQTAFHNYVVEGLNYIPESLISEETEGELGLISLKEAYERIHKPVETNNRQYLRRVALEKLTERIAAFKFAKNLRNNRKNRKYKNDINFDIILKNAGFSLTESQEKAVEKIKNLLNKNERMNAVLCGDVGSGKTIVAAIAAFYAIKSGYQVAMAAPTELLAEQHRAFFERIFAGTGVSFEFISGATTAGEKKRIYALAEAGETDLVVGTHAVFTEKMNFKNLALGICDEQHRFGVAQRNSLFEKGSDCDVLTLSATPIPRTMCLAAYGEAEYITIERRKRGNIKTSIVPGRKRADMFRYLAKRCDEGSKIYLIAPRIADSEGIDRENCEDLFKETCKYIPKNYVGLMHGKMKPAEKNEVMEKFRTGEIRALVATTVVEVGVDVPDATIMAITDADRLGLAALHQLRGRVGRNGADSYCFLLTSGETERLKILTESDNGFEIAEKDFDLRGGGDIFGLEQSGAGTLKYIDAALLKIAKITAERVDLRKNYERLKKIAEELSLDDVTLG